MAAFRPGVHNFDVRCKTDVENMNVETSSEGIPMPNRFNFIMIFLSQREKSE